MAQSRDRVVGRYPGCVGTGGGFVCCMVVTQRVCEERGEEGFYRK